MLPKVVVHNEVSIGCSITGFSTDMGLYYSIMRSGKPKIILLGSGTAIKALPNPLPKEKDEDFKKPSPNGKPYWCLVDSKGRLFEKLHYYRSLQMYIQDVIIMVCDKTPESYLTYLKSRNYDIILTKSKSTGGVTKSKEESENFRVDLKQGLIELKKRYEAPVIYTDSGGTLNSALLDESLVDSISLLVNPTVVGGGDKERVNLFRGVDNKIEGLKVGSVKAHGDYVHIVYDVKK